MEQIEQFVNDFALFLLMSVERPLAADEYRVQVSYEVPRDNKMLEAEFLCKSSSDLLFNREWRLHLSSDKRDRTPGERIMLVKRIESEADDIIEMDRLGYRPATHLEAYAFAKANPELLRQHWILALGSTAVYDGHRYSVALRKDSDGRIVVNLWFGDSWYSHFRILFVRKFA